MRVARSSLGSLSLGPDDSCYDPNHPWWLPNFLNDSAECACIAADGRPIGEQCASVQGVAQTMGQEIGFPIGAAVGGVGTGITSGVGSGVAAGVSTGTPIGIVLFAVTIGVVLLFAFKK